MKRSKSNIIKHKGFVIKKMILAINDVTRQVFGEPSFEVLRNMYLSVESSMIEACGQDAVCAMELRRRVSESIFRASIIKNTDDKAKLNAFKDLINNNMSEELNDDFSMFMFSVMLLQEAKDQKTKKYAIGKIRKFIKVINYNISIYNQCINNLDLEGGRKKRGGGRKKRGHST